MQLDQKRAQCHLHYEKTMPIMKLGIRRGLIDGA
jgi:hypothetical protein